MNKLVTLIPLLPLIGFLINGIFRKGLPKTISAVVGSGTILVSFILSVLVFLEVKNGNTQLVTLFDFISVGSLSVPFSFRVDYLFFLNVNQTFHLRHSGERLHPSHLTQSPLTNFFLSFTKSGKPGD